MADRLSAYGRVRNGFGRAFRIKIPTTVPSDMAPLFRSRVVAGRAAWGYFTIASFIYYILYWPANRDFGWWFWWAGAGIVLIPYIWLTTRLWLVSRRAGRSDESQ
jgi:hypothetical protein